MIQISLALPWTADEFKILRRILKSDGSLRASKPEINDRWDSYAAYVWRMLSFYVSADPKLQCMPVMCYYDLLVDHNDRPKIAAELNKVVDRIMALIPESEWHGVVRWQE